MVAERSLLLNENVGDSISKGETVHALLKARFPEIEKVNLRLVMKRKLFFDVDTISADANMNRMMYRQVCVFVSM